MDRTKPVRFFKGLEIEKTKFFLEPTMIAPGQYDPVECEQMVREHECTHILLGYMYDPAGNPLDMDIPKAFACAETLMDKGIKVTMEIRPDQITQAFADACPQPDGKYGDLFCILVGTAFPEYEKLKKFTTFKLHDQWDTSKNPGVFCIPAEHFQTHGQLTQWPAYSMDLWLK